MEEYSNKNNLKMSGGFMKHFSGKCNKQKLRNKNESNRNKGFTGTAMVNC